MLGSVMDAHYNYLSLYWIQWKAKSSLQCPIYRGELNCTLVRKTCNKFQENYRMGKSVTDST